MTGLDTHFARRLCLPHNKKFCFFYCYMCYLWCSFNEQYFSAEQVSPSPQGIFLMVKGLIFQPQIGITKHTAHFTHYNSSLEEWRSAALTGMLAHSLSVSPPSHTHAHTPQVCEKCRWWKKKLDVSINLEQGYKSLASFS